MLKIGIRADFSRAEVGREGQGRYQIITIYVYFTFDIIIAGRAGSSGIPHPWGG